VLSTRGISVAFRPIQLHGGYAGYLAGDYGLERIVRDHAVLHQVSEGTKQDHAPHHRPKPGETWWIAKKC
jgi:hypothetical protein